MADNNAKVAENVPGKWFVDNSCSLCETCMEEAPMLLKYNENKTHVFFAKQPATPDEEAAALRAMDVCPVSAIGNDAA